MTVKEINEDLKKKAISIKGKDYVLVKDRIIAFNENHPNGCIKTFRQFDATNNREIVQAMVVPDMDTPDRYFTGYSQAVYEWMINWQAALENCESSAVWRALAMMWYWVIESIASADEMRKAEGSNNNWTIQKEISKADTPTKQEDDKPWFNKEQLDKFVPIADKYEDADAAIRLIRSKYKLSKSMEWEVRKLYESIKEIKWS